MGGGLVRVPAADRPAGRARGAGHAGRHAGAVRPARDAARRGGRAAARLPARDPPRGARRGRGRASSAPASPSWRPRCGAPRATTSARPTALEAEPRPGRRPGAARPREPGGAVDLGRHPRACCRCWPATPGCACSSPPASRRTSAASATGAAGFWLPECAYAPGLERELADHGVRAFCVDQTDGARPRLARAARAGAHVRRAWWPCRSTGRPWSWCGTTAAATRCTRPTATTTAAPCTTCARGTTRGGAYDPDGRARARARARARLRGALRRAPGRLRGRARAAGAAHLRARHRAARPLVVRGAGVAARPWSRRPTRSGSSWSP